MWNNFAYVSMCVGEWSRRQSYSTAFFRRRQCALWFVIRQWRSRVGRWLGQWSHSTAEQSTTTTTRPRRRHELSSQAVVANTIMLHRTHITALRSAQQQQWVVVVWRHVAIQSTLTRLTNWWVSASLQVAICHARPWPIIWTHNVSYGRMALFHLITRNTFCGTWYLPIATSTMNELFLQLWPDAWRMNQRAIFPLPV